MSESRFLNSLRTQRSMKKDADWTLKMLRQKVHPQQHTQLILRMGLWHVRLLQPHLASAAWLLEAWHCLLHAHQLQP